MIIYLPAAADEVVMGDGVAVPDTDTDLAEAFDEGNHSLFLEARVPSSICIYWHILLFDLRESQPSL